MATWITSNEEVMSRVNKAISQDKYQISVSIFRSDGKIENFSATKNFPYPDILSMAESTTELLKEIFNYKS